MTEVVDITKKDAARRKRGEGSQENEKRYRYFVEAVYREGGPDVKSEAGSKIMTILDALPFYVMLIDEGHNILFANKAVGQGLGVDPVKIIGEYCPTVVHGLEGAYPGCPLEESVEKGGIAIEREFLDGDSQRWYVSAVYPTGQVTREGKRIFFHTTRDITERKQTENELVQLKEFHERVVNGIADAISVINIKDFRIAGVNEAFLGICGLKEEEVIGKTCYEITHHRDSPCLAPDDPCPIGDLLETGKSTTLEHVHFDKENRKTSVEVSAHPIYENGKIKQIVHIAKDITERKKTEIKLKNAYDKLKIAHEDLKSLNRLKSDIISNVTHELRTPITIAGGALELAKEEEDRESREKLLKLARDALMHQDFIVEDLVDAASMVDGRRKLKSTTVNLVDAISFVRSELEPIAISRKIEIDVRAKRRLPLVKVNYMQLHRILRNLINNAVKFNKEGGKVIIEAAQKDDEVEVCVKDTGIGIEAAELEKIFESLYQIDASPTRPYGGTGMGLAVVKEIIESYGGRIKVESELGRGSKFCFTLPIAQSVLI
jgi:PAS domain S-box-containing protein